MAQFSTIPMSKSNYEELTGVFWSAAMSIPVYHPHTLMRRLCLGWNSKHRNWNM